MNLKLLSFTLIALLILPLVSQAWAWTGYVNPIANLHNVPVWNGLYDPRYYAYFTNIADGKIRLIDIQCNAVYDITVGSSGTNTYAYISFRYNNVDYVETFDNNTYKLYQINPPASCQAPTLTFVRNITDTGALTPAPSDAFRLFYFNNTYYGVFTTSISGVNRVLSTLSLNTNPLFVKVNETTSSSPCCRGAGLRYYTNDFAIIQYYDGSNEHIHKISFQTLTSIKSIQGSFVGLTNDHLVLSVSGSARLYDYDLNLVTTSIGSTPYLVGQKGDNTIIMTNKLGTGSSITIPCLNRDYLPISQNRAFIYETRSPTDPTCVYKIYDRSQADPLYTTIPVYGNPVAWHDVCLVQQDTRSTGLAGRPNTSTGYYVWSNGYSYANIRNQLIAIEPTALTDKNITLYNVDFDKYKYLAIVYEKNMYFYFIYYGTEITSQTQAIKVKQGVNQLLDIVQILKGACTYKVTTYIIEGNSANVNITLPAIIDFQYAGQYGWEFSHITNTQAQITLRTSPSNHTTINPTTINIYNQSGTLLQTNTVSASLGTPVNINYTPASSVIYRVVRVTWNDLEGKERNVYFYWYNTSTSSTDYFTTLRNNIKGIFDNFASRIGIGSSTLFYLSLLVFIPPLATRANLHIIMIFITAGFLWGFWTYGAGLVTEPFLYIFAIAGIAIAIWNRYG